MPKIYVPISMTVEHRLTPVEVANLFCDMSANEQAEFFNAVAEISDSWSNSFAGQVLAVTHSHQLNGGGITIMRQIGEFAEGLMSDLRTASVSAGDIKREVY